MNTKSLMILAGAVGLILLGIGVWYVWDTTRDSGSIFVDGTFSVETDAFRVTASAPIADDENEEEVREYIEQQVGTFITEAQVAYDAFDHEGDVPWRAHTLEVTYEEHEVSEHRSFLVTEYYYTGGATGIQTLKTFMFNPEGEHVLLADIISVSEEEVLAAVQEELYEVNGVVAGEEGAFGDVIDELTFASLENFYLTTQNLVVAFSQYEVAPGAAGALKIELPRSEYSSL